MRNKHTYLQELTTVRKKARWPGYKCIGDYRRGKYECDFVSPYTRGACNVNSDLMLLLQDWSSDDVLSGPYLHTRCTVGHDPTRSTNKRLKRLLHRHFGLTLERIYATNVFPFVKVGPMNKSIPMRDLARAAREFALPQIQIVGPRLAVCLGKAAFDAVALAAGRDRTASLAEAVEIASPFKIGATQVWCQAHPSQQGTNNRNRNGVDQVERDWARMAGAYNERVKQADASTVSGEGSGPVLR